MAVLQRSSNGSRNSSSINGCSNKEEGELLELNMQHNANSPDERLRLQQLHPKEEDVVCIVVAAAASLPIP